MSFNMANTMRDTMVSMREMQRNYSRIIRTARTSRRPVFLGSRGVPHAVLLDIGKFERLVSQARKKRQRMQWRSMERTLDRIAVRGKQGTNLSRFVRYDRKAH